MNTTPSSATRASQQGVVLLESMIAVLIFSIGIIAVVGLQAAMIKNTAEARYRGEASFIAQQQIGRVWADPDNIIAYLTPASGISIDPLLPNGRVEITQVVANQLMVVVYWTQPGGGGEHRHTTTAFVSGAGAAQ